MADAFGDLLRSWRNLRRMSQLDLGLAAGVSARHISFLETGRSRPSRGMVLALSESLGVPRGTRNVLLHAAGFSQAFFARDLADDDMAPIREAMEWTLDRHNPYPAIALDRHWRLVRMNTVAAALFETVHLSIGDSLLDGFVSDGPLPGALENYGDVVRHLVMRLRVESAHLGGDPVLDAAAGKLASGLGDRVPAPHEEMPAVVPARLRIGDSTLSLFSTIAQFGSTEDIALADLRIELMFPADDATRRFLFAQFAEGRSLPTSGSRAK